MSSRTTRYPVRAGPRAFRSTNVISDAFLFFRFLELLFIAPTQTVFSRQSPYHQISVPLVCSYSLVSVRGMRRHRQHGAIAIPTTILPGL